MIISETAADTFVQLGFDGTVTYISACAQTLIGYDANEITGRSLASYVHESDRDALEAAWIAVREGCDRISRTYRMCHADGRYIETELSFGLVRDARRREITHGHHQRRS